MRGTPYFPNQGLRGIVRAKEQARQDNVLTRAEIRQNRNAARIAIVARSVGAK